MYVQNWILKRPKRGICRDTLYAGCRTVQLQKILQIKKKLILQFLNININKFKNSFNFSELKNIFSEK